MRKVTNAVVIVSAIIACVLVPALSVIANTGRVSVTPIFPENQDPETSGFFNLRVTAGARQRIEIAVNNPGEEDIQVEVSLFAAATNSNGVIDYTAPGRMDESLAHAFEEMATLSGDGKITVPAGMSTTVPIDIVIPPEGFDGIVLGSIHLLLGITDDERAAAGAIVNRFAHIVILRLQERDTPVQVDFALGAVTTERANNRVVLVAEIRNPQPRLTMQAAVHAQVYPAGSDEAIFTRTEVTADFAPNTIFPFLILGDSGFYIEPGNYIARIQVERQEERWEFEQAFTVEKPPAPARNETAVHQQQQGQRGLSWLLVRIGGVAFLLLLAVSALVLKAKRVREQEYEEFRQRMQALKSVPRRQAEKPQSADKKDL